MDAYARSAAPFAIFTFTSDRFSALLADHADLFRQSQHDGGANTLTRVAHLLTLAARSRNFMAYGFFTIEEWRNKKWATVCHLNAEGIFAVFIIGCILALVGLGTVIYWIAR
jgi:hypothetical protein